MNLKFVIGLGPLTDYSSVKELDYFLRVYQKKIAICYIAAPFKPSLKDGKSTYVHYSEQAAQELQTELNLLRKYQIPIQLCVNNTQPYILTKSVLKSAQFFKEHFLVPDSMVITDKFIPAFLQKFPEIPLTYSYNNNLEKANLNNLKACDTVVIGDKRLRAIVFMQNLKQRYSLKIELLVNCGCHIKCNKHCHFFNQCYRRQNQLISQKGLEWCLAQQSLFPTELNLYPDGLIDLIKLSTRNKMSLTQIASLIEIYDRRPEIQKIKDLNLELGHNWGYFIGIKPLTDLAEHAQQINLEEILRIKSQIWSNILQRPVYLKG